MVELIVHDLLSIQASPNSCKVDVYERTRGEGREFTSVSKGTWEELTNLCPEEIERDSVSCLVILYLGSMERKWSIRQALFLPVSKKLKAQKTQKISTSKKTQGPFWAKNSVCWSQFEISAKKLWNFDHLKPILTDFMVKNETFKDFLIILAQNSCIWGEMFKILKKTLKILRKNSTIWKKTQCYGVFRTQCDSLKSVNKKACTKATRRSNSSHSIGIHSRLFHKCYRNKLVSQCQS